MGGKRRTLTRIGLVIELLYLSVALYALVDTVALGVRMGRGVGFQFIATALATIVPGVFLVRGYLDYGRDRDKGKKAVLACVAATAVIFGLSLVPRLKTVLFGIGDIPAFQTLYIRLLDMMFGLQGSGRIFLINLIVQAIIPLVVLVCCEGGGFMGDGAPRDLGSGLLRVAGSVLIAWAAYAVTEWLIRSDVFGHSWIIVGFIPIPGQIMLICPAIAAVVAIVAIWSKR